MNSDIPNKSYFRIGEVSRILGVEPYVIRYWEAEFKTVRPIRTKSDQRLYRRKDVEALVDIRSLLYEKNFTIRGAKKQLAVKKGEKENNRADSYYRRLVEVKRRLLSLKKIIDR